MLGTDTWSCLCLVGILFLWVLFFLWILGECGNYVLTVGKLSGVLIGGGSGGFQIRIVSGY